MARTPVALVTGFLGSGKTTLVNRLLRLPGMADTAVVVNEFGEIGLDHDLIAASDDAVVLLDNGCLCCAVKGDLVRTLDELHRKRAGGTLTPFARVLIETSGLAEPGPVIEALQSEPTLRARYAMAGVVTVVDAINAPATIESRQEALAQLAVADRIAVTKLDLLDEQRRSGGYAEALHERLQSINPGARIAHASDVLDAQFCFGARAPTAGDDRDSVEAWLGAERYLGQQLRARRALAPRHDARVRSFCIVRQDPLGERALQLFIQALSRALGPALLRIKGLIAVAERTEAPAVLHGAQALLHPLTWLERWPTTDHRTRIVVVALDDRREEVEALLAMAERLAGGAAHARTPPN